jgi:orotate phosphoribosyltransferase
MKIESQRLLQLLAKHAYQYNPRGFVLVSGGMSTEYLDCKQALSHPETLPLLGKIFFERLHPEIVAIGGLTMGADPIAIATAHISASESRTVRWFGVRKDQKGHGRRRLIEGHIVPGETVAIVDDVVTSGSSTIDAIKKSQEFGLQIAQVIVLVDREAGGIINIKQVVGQTVLVETIFTKNQVREEWTNQNS